MTGTWQPVWWLRNRYEAACWWLSGRRLVDLPCGCQDMVSRHSKVLEREYCDQHGRRP
jgi:hypothetical protein